MQFKRNHSYKTMIGFIARHADCSIIPMLNGKESMTRNYHNQYYNTLQTCPGYHKKELENNSHKMSGSYQLSLPQQDDCTNILRKTIEGYLDTVPSLTFNAIKTKLIMHTLGACLRQYNTIQYKIYL